MHVVRDCTQCVYFLHVQYNRLNQLIVILLLFVHYRHLLTQVQCQSQQGPLMPRMDWNVILCQLGYIRIVYFKATLYDCVYKITVHVGTCRKQELSQALI